MISIILIILGIIALIFLAIVTWRFVSLGGGEHISCVYETHPLRFLSVLAIGGIVGFSFLLNHKITTKHSTDQQIAIIQEQIDDLMSEKQNATSQDEKLRLEKKIDELYNQKMELVKN